MQARHLLIAIGSNIVMTRACAWLSCSHHAIKGAQSADDTASPRLIRFFCSTQAGVNAGCAELDGGHVAGSYPWHDARPPVARPSQAERCALQQAFVEFPLGPARKGEERDWSGSGSYCRDKASTAKNSQHSKGRPRLANLACSWFSVNKQSPPTRWRLGLPSII